MWFTSRLINAISPVVVFSLQKIRQANITSGGNYERALEKLRDPTHQSKNAPSVGKLGRVTSLRIPPRRPPAIDYCASTLTRTFRIGKKQNYFCVFIGVWTRVAPIVFEIGFLLPQWPRWDRETNHLPSSCDTRARELRIHEKKTSTLIRVSSWIFLFFHSFVPAYASECTLCRAFDRHSSQRLFDRATVVSRFVPSSICTKISVQTTSSWWKGGRKEKRKSGLRSIYVHMGAIIE